ncbi:hypothetical protein [Corynebacterium matruchotii]|uniref:hypothetical protein n=1 Tax=Corynebacterium matruchotii TaxID=43768 RepID=UPI003C7042AF
MRSVRVSAQIRATASKRLSAVISSPTVCARLARAAVSAVLALRGVSPVRRACLVMPS